MANESEVHPSPSALPKEGDLLLGKYQIERVLGQGGMGVVVAAHHLALRQKVAVKFLLPDAVQRADANERFLREARAAVAIQSEHVARVMDVGTLESGSPYIVMELLSGSDLGEVLRVRGVLSVTETVDYVLQAGEAIAEAHALGIIHRDLKPANLFLSTRADGSALVKVLDFGISKATKLDVMDASLTAGNAVMGSPYYMSPEQIRSLKAIDSRADIWALGVILYQLLTGRRPFEAEAIGALFLVVAQDPPLPPTALRPDLPPALEAAILRCLEKDPKNRPQSVADLARALAPFGSEESRISVERIHRVLANAAASPRRASADGMGPFDAASQSSLPDAGVAGGRRSNPPVGLKSGSMIGVASSVEAGQVRADAAAPGRATAPRSGRGRGLMIGLVAVLAVGAGVSVAVFRPSPSVSRNTTTPTEAAVAPPLGGTAIAPEPAAAGSADPVTIGSPLASAIAAPDVASAAPSAAAAPSASAKLFGIAKPHPPTSTKKSKDPLDRWK